MVPLEIKVEDTVLQGKQYDDKPEWGYVLGTGPGKLLNNGERVPIDLQPGDVVLFMPYGATKFRSLGVDFLHVRAEDVISKYIG